MQQQPTLLPGTIFENIAVGKPDATHAEVVAAARLANADEFVKLLPLGYDTTVGSCGEQLSGGQRQRIAIAQALIRCPRRNNSRPR